MKNKKECQFCGKMLSTTQRLLDHFRRYHPNDVNWKCKCKLCGKQFMEQRTMLTHINRSHKDEITVESYYNKYIFKNTECILDGCKNKIPFNLKHTASCSNAHYNQIRFKTNILEDAYECKICPCKFKDIRGLSRHIGETHADVITQEEYYNKYIKKPDDASGTCLWCNKPLEFITIGEGYRSFCYNTDCNVRWYNKNTDRLDKFSKSLKEVHKNHDVIPTQLGYWLKKGYTEEEAKEKLTKRQRVFSLDICIEKHGEKEGTKIWEERQEKWIKTMKNKPPEEILRINRLKAGSSQSISAAETELCNILEAEQSYVIDITKGYIYDIRKGNAIIEYNGDYWHSNPRKYKPNFFNKSTQKTASEKWKDDEIKRKFAEDCGYKVKFIWEMDYNKDKQRVIKECIDFIENNK